MGDFWSVHYGIVVSAGIKMCYCHYLTLDVLDEIWNE